MASRPLLLTRSACPAAHPVCSARLPYPLLTGQVHARELVHEAKFCATFTRGSSRGAAWHITAGSSRTEAVSCTYSQCACRSSLATPNQRALAEREGASKVRRRDDEILKAAAKLSNACGQLPGSRAASSWRAAANELRRAGPRQGRQPHVDTHDDAWLHLVKWG